MDVEELDAWLGTGPGDGEESPPPWREPDPRGDDLTADRGRVGGGARKRWPLFVGGGGLVWLLVMVLAAMGGSDDAPAPTLSPVPTLATSPTAPPVSPVVTEVPTAAVADAPSEAPGRVTGPVSGVAAVMALREWLPAATAGEDRYLEWAFPVGAEPLGADVAIVHVDALWLAGTDGHYDEVHRGRWAVPVRADGAVLGQPWAVGPADPPEVEALAPPVLRQRVEEVEAALADDGWRDVVVHGSEPHPELPGVWVALVDGGDPAGVTRVGATIWLADHDGLAVPGGPLVDGSGR